jgi:geranylgeranyl diphosphate synthase type I
MAQAINLGDMIAFLGPALIADPKFPGKRVTSAIGILSRTVHSTVAGQIMDVDVKKSIAELKVNYVLDISRYKTAYYSFVAPLQIGCVLAGVKPNDSILADIEAFGIPAGIAFQLQDDILGIYADEKILGKSITSDLAEAKKTLFFIELYQRLAQNERKRLSDLWGNKDVGASDLIWVRKRGLETKALNKVNKVASDLVAEAKTVVPRLSAESRVRRLLEDLADFTIHREK